MGLVVPALGAILVIGGLATRHAVRERCVSAVLLGKVECSLEDLLKQPPFSPALRWARVSVFAGVGLWGWLVLASLYNFPGRYLMSGYLVHGDSGRWMQSLILAVLGSFCMVLVLIWLRMGVRALYDEPPAWLVELLRKAWIAFAWLCALCATVIVAELLV